MNVCDLEFQGQPSRSHDFFNIFDIYDLENVRIDTKINFVSCLQTEIRKVMQKGVWPWFSKSCNKDRILSLSPLDSLTPKSYPWEICSKNSDGKAKIQWGGIHPPLGRPKVDFYLGHLRVNNLLRYWNMKQEKSKYGTNSLPWQLFSGQKPPNTGRPVKYGTPGETTSKILLWSKIQT